MTRILLTYSNAAERKLAARRASRLSARGIDVELASTAAAATLRAAAYDRVLDASSCEPLPPGEQGHEGTVSIASACAIVAAIPRTRAPEPLRAPSTPARILAALFVGISAALLLGLLSLPLFYPIGLGILVTLATLAVLQDEPRPALLAGAPTDVTPVVRCG